MATIILILLVVLFSIAIIPWSGYQKYSKLRHIDTMAGDEGED